MTNQMIEDVRELAKQMNEKPLRDQIGITGPYELLPPPGKPVKLPPGRDPGDVSRLAWLTRI